MGKREDIDRRTIRLDLAFRLNRCAPGSPSRRWYDVATRDRMPQNVARAGVVLRRRQHEEQIREPVHLADHRRRDQLLKRHLGDFPFGAADNRSRDMG
jgi:hypothetical protein